MQNREGGEWTFDEKKVFENALAEEQDLSSPFLFQRINAILPTKTVEQIKIQLHKLVQDVMAIENDLIPLPNYDHPLRKAVPWTEDEHKSFLIGLSKYGKGEWKKISKQCVESKTASQVASHAQKYFRRVKCSTPLERRRYSIHDIRLLNTSIVEAPARFPTHPAFVAHIVHDQLHHHRHPSGTNNEDDGDQLYARVGHVSSQHAKDVLDY